MCGLVGGFSQEIFPFLKEGLLRLEYRGYDSWGMTVVQDEEWQTIRRLGAPSSGLPLLNPIPGTCGLAHTRWASHGRVCLENTHPIAGGKFGSVQVVHNGIIENADALRKALSADGYPFATGTDTEVVGHLLDAYLASDGDPYAALLATLKGACERLRGRYAFAALSRKYPGRIFLASFGSPLVVCPEAGLFASDAVALSGFVPEGAMAFAMDNEVAILDVLHGCPQLDKDLMGPLRGVDIPPAHSSASKTRGSWMFAEMHEQVELVRRGPAPVPSVDAGGDLDGLELLGCGSSYHAALLGQAYFEWGSPLFVRARLAGNLSPWFYGDCAYVAITQSGETADMLRSVERLSRPENDPEVRTHLFVLTNRPHSTIARLGTVVEMGCGEERAVAATKSFTASCLRLLEMAHAYMEDAVGIEHYLVLADALEETLKQDISFAASLARFYGHLFVCGKGFYYPVALEGALKLKECAYKHAEGLYLSEVKHGPLALFDQSALVFVLVGSEGDLSGLQEIAARNCRLVALTHKDMAWRVESIIGPGHTLVVPTTHSLLQPLVFAVYLQRLAFEVAMMAGHDPDLPRAICKSVTVE